MKNILISLAFLAIVTSSFGRDNPPMSRNEVLNGPAIRALYSPVAMVWLRSVTVMGRPAAEIWTYLAFEDLEVASSTAFGVAKLKVGKDVLLKVAGKYIQNPGEVCKELADSLMDEGMKAYGRNYTRYNSWKRTGMMSLDEYKMFVEDNHNVNYLGLGRDLFADIQSYKHKQGKYSLEKEFSASWKGAQVLMDEIDEIKGSADSPSAYGTIKEIVGVAQGNLANYPPYRDHLARVAKLEEKMDTEFPLAKKEEKAEKAPVEMKEEKFKLPELKNPPSRPVMRIGNAVDLGNAQEVWANIYYKTERLEGWLEMALNKELGWRLERSRELVKEDPSIEETSYKNLFSDGREREIFAEKMYNLVKSPDYTTIVNLLIDKASASEKNQALAKAVKYVNMDAIHRLVSSGADVSDEILIMAVWQRYPNRITYLIKHAEKPNMDELLLSAIMTKDHPPHYLTIKILLDYGSNVNCKDSRYGKTPLYYAINRKEVNIRVVMLFMEHGAKVDPQAMEAAKNSGNRLLVKLLEKGLASDGTIDLQ